MSDTDRSSYHWLMPAALGAFMVATAVWSKPFSYSLLHLAMLAALYLLVALGLYGASLAVARIGAPAALAASAVVAFIVVLHYREQTRPSGTAESLDKTAVLVPFLIICAVVAMLYFLALRLSGAAEEWVRGLLVAAAATVVFFGALTVFYYGGNTFRWHLLRHNTMLGALAYHLYAEDTTAVRDALWREGRDPPPAADPAGEAPPPVAPAAPNIVFVLIDTLRADSLAAYGGEADRMPFINALAARSLVFSDVKVNSSWTFPSMASFFTGLLPEEHGAVWGGSLSADHRTLAEAMAARGYRTAAFVSNGVAVREDRGMGQGFVDFHQLGVTGSRYPPAERINQAVFEWLDDAEPLPEPAEDSPREPPEEPAVQPAVEPPEEPAVAPGAAPPVQRQPLFLYVHYLDPHVPYLESGNIDPASHRAALDAYDADVLYLDGHVRDLVDTLAMRLDGPTYLFFVSDHGEEFGEHGERGHGRALYDEVLRVPAFLHIDGGEAGFIEAPLEGRDFFALLELLASRDQVDVRAWAGAAAREERYASTYYTNSSPIYRLLRPYRATIALRAIEKDGYTLIWSGQGDTYELYDMSADPGQLVNIAGSSPEIVAALAAAMEAAPRYWTPRIERPFTDEELERLRALGYLR